VGSDAVPAVPSDRPGGANTERRPLADSLNAPSIYLGQGIGVGLGYLAILYGSIIAQG
jgi:hypothetical protein